MKLIPRDTCPFCKSEKIKTLFKIKYRDKKLSDFLLAYYKTEKLNEVLENYDYEIIKCNVVVGGWPCQDISIAGKGKGLRGENSKMFYDMVNYAKNASAHTIIAENVPNLLKLDSGSVFREVINEFVKLNFKMEKF
mgnify:CR=1 FL=1